MEKNVKLKKKVALVAHDNMKSDLAAWVDWNSEVLSSHALICTGTTGKVVEKTIINRQIDLKHQSGALTTPFTPLDITLLKS